MPLMKAISKWTSEGWHFLLPHGETHYAHGTWHYVANVGGDAIPEGYYRSYAYGGYCNMEDFGSGTWFGPLDDLMGRVDGSDAKLTPANAQSYDERIADIKRAKKGDIWVHRKSGRQITLMSTPVGYSEIIIRHDTGKQTRKQDHYIASDYYALNPQS